MDLTRVDGVDGFTALKVISEIWHGHDEVGERRPLRFLVGTEPGQSGNRWQGNQLKDESQRQPSRGSIALGHHALHRSDSAWGRFSAERRRTCESRRPSPPRPASWPASSIPLFHAAVRPGLRGCWRRILREPVSAAGVARGKTAGGPTGLPVSAYARW